jgi:hypothetical protein
VLGGKYGSGDETSVLFLLLSSWLVTGSAISIVDPSTLTGAGEVDEGGGAFPTLSSLPLVTDRRTTLNSDSNQLPISLEEAGSMLSDLALRGDDVLDGSGVRGGVISSPSQSSSDKVADSVDEVRECGREVSRSGSNHDDAGEDGVSDLADCERVTAPPPSSPPKRVGGATAMDNTRCGGCWTGNSFLM